jgi:hypothetical protein
MQAGQCQSTMAFWFVEGEHYERYWGEHCEHFWGVVDGSTPRVPLRTDVRDYIRARLSELRRYAADFR